MVAEFLPPLQKRIADAKADPNDYVRAFCRTDEAPDQVVAYWALIRIEAAVREAKGEKGRKH
ncbi:hypothetical protein FRUB_05755 [Fimbriiglobus ruber]|uniref:Uncharacterized protein n=1 Tax=Fimbriiglobus ruber TaxID=1908690 RepID=A0A225DU16_9BACT|nr:hypothetical protein FRUB_05755 [Fimbriiglobus ruber]